MVEQETLNLLVVGSSPTRCTICNKQLMTMYRRQKILVCQLLASFQVKGSINYPAPRRFLVFTLSIAQSLLSPWGVGTVQSAWYGKPGGCKCQYGSRGRGKQKERCVIATFRVPESRGSRASFASGNTFCGLAIDRGRNSCAKV